MLTVTGQLWNDSDGRGENSRGAPSGIRLEIRMEALASQEHVVLQGSSDVVAETGQLLSRLTEVGESRSSCPRQDMARPTESHW